MIEKWKECSDYPGYFVSNLGNVRKGDKLLKQHKESQGYLRVCLRYGWERVHRLVATEFVSNPYGKDQVDHKNDIKTDNRAENLQWVTTQENTRKAGKAGVLSHHFKRRPIVSVNMNTYEVKHFKSQAEAERETGVDNRNISACLRKHRLITANYKFYYEEDWRKPA